MAETTNTETSTTEQTAPTLPDTLSQAQLRKACLLFLSMALCPDSTDPAGPVANWTTTIAPHVEDLSGAKDAVTTTYTSMSQELAYAQSALKTMLNNLTTSTWDEPGSCPLTLGDITDMFEVVAPDAQSSASA